MKTLFILVLGLNLNLAMARQCPLPLNLKNFHANPSAFLDAHPVKFKSDCTPVNISAGLANRALPLIGAFSAEEIAANQFVKIKDQMRKELCHRTPDARICLQEIAPGENILQGRAAIGDLDDPANILGNRYLKTLVAMEESGLKAGQMAIDPWSSWYWPLAAGQLAFRFQDKNMVKIFDMPTSSAKNLWPRSREYVSRNLFVEDVNKLAASEKYDRLVGDRNYSLSKRMWESGQWYQDQQGKVETWMGICNGWAVASYMLPRPVKPITVTSTEGEEITFLPDDLKALGSLLWANGNMTTSFMGGRCNDERPKKDRNGRVISEECFDNNPGAWHLAVVNRIGRDKLSMVMDATFDYEVWNHPIVSYSYRYFNPQTMDEVETLAEAKVLKQDFSKDKFKKYRGEDTYAVVGVIMEVKYLVETFPAGKRTDSVSDDAFEIVHYTYDLELNDRGSVIGGEWYVNKHPDFLWTPDNGTDVYSDVDELFPDKINLNTLTRANVKNLIKEAAPRASSEDQPIGQIVKALFEAAKAK